MIELGLARISRLLKDVPIPWTAIHVAGTNGKGSVCAYASAMLNSGRIRCGRFTSPHLIDRWDCISIDDKTVNKQLFYEVEATMKARDQREQIAASEFELLTATAIEIFNLEKIEVGVVEVGLGGRYDATNFLQNSLVTVITKIGKDHQSFLGESLEEIAYQKAGIMKHGAHCFVDGSNSPCVIDVLGNYAKDVQAASLVLVSQSSRPKSASSLWSVLRRDNFEEHQQMNIHLAYEAVQIAAARVRPLLESQSLLPVVAETSWPGRLQLLDIEPLIGRKQRALLDGAHNAQSAEVLGSYVDRRLRQDRCPVTWVVAVSQGKDIEEILSHLLRPGDNLIAVAFHLVEGMPWISPAEVEEILGAARGIGTLKSALGASGNLIDALELAANISKGGPMVIAGSLYLASDVLRLLRDNSPAVA